MSKVSALPAEIVQWLSTLDQLSDITFLTEFPAVRKAIPLKKNIVAIGLSAVTLSDKFVDDGTGILIKQEYCRTASMRISLAVHVPFSKGGHTCHEVFAKVVDALSFSSDLEILKSGCGRITADRDTDALVLTGYLDVEADFCPAETSDLYFASFLDKELLCGSHIRDTDIHVSPEEKAKWNTPLAFSSYTGDGSSSRTISLGFRPSYVAVFASEYPCTEFEAETGMNKIYTAYAVPGIAGSGVEITANGFRVRNGPVLYGRTVPFLNESGVQYGFVSAI